MRCAHSQHTRPFPYRSSKETGGAAQDTEPGKRRSKHTRASERTSLDTTRQDNGPVFGRENLLQSTLFSGGKVEGTQGLSPCLRSGSADLLYYTQAQRLINLLQQRAGVKPQELNYLHKTPTGGRRWSVSILRVVSFTRVRE